VVLDLIEIAKKAFIPATHVLFDTWFCSPSSLIAIKEIGYDVIVMAKKNIKDALPVQGKDAAINGDIQTKQKNEEVDQDICFP
jgi:hypothetical protein